MRRFAAETAGLLLMVAQSVEQDASPEIVACYLEAYKALGDLTGAEGFVCTLVALLAHRLNPFLRQCSA